MQKREKILGVVLIASLGAMFGWPYLYNTFFSPLQEMEARIESLSNEKDLLWKQQLDLAKKDADLKGWYALSLPPNPENAQRLYLEWLTNLAHLSGFENLKVTLERRVDDSVVSVTIPVMIEGRAKLREIAEFLERFESVDLLQRIARCELASPSNEGDPELNVTILAEGLSIKNAVERARLFPQTELFEEISKDATKLTVVSNKGFPETLPFCVRLGAEFLNVTAIDGNTWTVQRGVERSYSDHHDAGLSVELFPLRMNADPAALSTRMLGLNLFTKPVPQVEYKPRLGESKPPAVIRGKAWTWKLDVAGWNPAFGTPKFELLSGPPGLELNERNGTLQWRSTAQAELGNHSVEMLIWGTNGRDAGFTPTLALRVRDPNQPPALSVEGPLQFFIGRESKVQLPATDPDGNGKPLSFALENGPTGMTLDSRTGELSWKPGDDSMPQKVDIRVKVTDGDELPESTTVTIPVTLAEDSARFTYLTGSVKRTSGQEEAWINDRATNQSRVLQPGQTFQIADFELTLETIGPTYVIVKRGDRKYRWRFEEPLTDMKPETGA